MYDISYLIILIMFSGFGFCCTKSIKKYLFSTRLDHIEGIKDIYIFIYRLLPWIIVSISCLISWYYSINKVISYSTLLNKKLGIHAKQVSSKVFTHEMNNSQYKIIRDYVNYSSITDFLILLLILFVAAILFSTYDIMYKSKASDYPLKYVSEKALYVLNSYLKDYVLCYIFDIIPIILAVMAAIEAIHPTSFNVEPFFQKCLRSVIPLLSSLKFIQICYSRDILDKFSKIVKSCLNCRYISYHLRSIKQFFSNINYSVFKSCINDESFNHHLSIKSSISFPYILINLIILFGYSLLFVNTQVQIKYIEMIVFIFINPLVFSIFGYLYLYYKKYNDDFIVIIKFLINIIISCIIFIIIYFYPYRILIDVTRLTFDYFNLIYALVIFIILSVLIDYKSNYNLCFQFAFGAVLNIIQIIINSSGGFMITTPFDNINIITIVMGYYIFFVMGEIYYKNKFNLMPKFLFSIAWGVVIFIYFRFDLYTTINVITYIVVLPLIISFIIAIAFISMEDNINAS